MSRAFRYAASALLRNAIPFLSLLALAPVLRGFSPWAPWLLAPALGLCLYRLTIVMHDCVHRTLFASPRLNVRIGRLLGAVTAVDFASFTKQHLRHHRNYGGPGDPQGFQYAGVSAMSRPRFAWHLLRPLLGFNLRYALPETLANPRNWRGFELGAFAAFQAAIAAIVTGGGAWLELALLPPVSAATFGLFFSQLRGIAEHAPGRDGQGARFVRSHAPTAVDRLFLYDLNFNYHAEHHRFPRHPSRKLASVLPVKLAPGMLRTLASLR